MRLRWVQQFGFVAPREKFARYVALCRLVSPCVASYSSSPAIWRGCCYED